MVCCKNIPEELKKLKQWVCVKNNSKVPMMSDVFLAASSSNSKTWSDYASACKAVFIHKKYDYLGFVFNDNNIVGIDIDCGFNQDGTISDIAKDIINSCQSYTELSRSKRGFHIFLKGDIDFKGKNNLKGIEIYKSSRYFIMTGNIFKYTKIIENQKAIDYVLQNYFKSTRQSQSKIKIQRIYVPIWKNVYNNGRINLRPSFPLIDKGSRNICLTSLAGFMHAIGYNQEQIYKELKLANQSCLPPLANTELLLISRSVSKYER